MRSGDFIRDSREILIYFSFIFKAFFQHFNLDFHSFVIFSNNCAWNRGARVPAASLCPGLRFYAHLGPYGLIVDRIIKPNEFLESILRFLRQAAIFQLLEPVGDSSDQINLVIRTRLLAVKQRLKFLLKVRNRLIF